MSMNLGTAVGYLELNTDRWQRGFQTAQSQMRTLADSSQSMGTRFSAAGKLMQSTGSAMSKYITLPLVGIGAASLKTAIDFESAFAGVRKTVDATEKQYKELENGIRSMSKQMPQSASEIATVAEAAGQLGIKREDVLSFTETMVKLGDTTNLSSEEAASALAKFANVTGMSMDNVDRLGSTIVALGNNLATTEADIVSMGQRMASAGSQIGMSESQILSWSGAMSSVGIHAEVGGSSFSKFAKDVQLAVETGGSKLEQFAKIAGMSSSDFQKAFKEDASQALQAFVKGLSESEERGTSVAAVLDDLGYKEVGMSQTLSSLAGGYGTLNDALEVGSKAWEENTALATEAETRYKTTESRLLILKNKFADLGISIGAILLPALESLMSGVERIVDWLGSLDEGTQKTIVTIGMVVAAIGPLLLAFGSILSAIPNMVEGWRILTSGIVVLRNGLAMLKLTLLTQIPVLRLLYTTLLTNPFAWVAVGIAGLALAFKYCWENVDGFKEFWIEAWENIKEAFSDTVETIKYLFGGFTEFFSLTWKTIEDTFKGAGQLLKDLLKGDFEAMKKDSEVIWNQMKQNFVNVGEAFKNATSDFTSKVKGIVDAWLQDSDVNIRTIWSGICEVFGSYGQIMYDVMKGYIDLIIAIFTGDWQSIPQIIIDTGNNIMTHLSEIWEGIKLIFSGALEIIKTHMVTKWEEIKMNTLETWENIKTTTTEKVSSMVNSVVTFFNELPYKIGFALGYALGTIIKWGTDTWSYLVTNVPLWIEGTVKFFSELPGKIWTWLVNAYQKTVQWGSQMLQKALETGSRFIQNVITYMQQLPSKVWNYLSQAISKAIQFATQFAQKGMQAAQKFSTNIINGLKSLPGRVVSIGRNIVQGLWNGISGAAGWLYSKVASFATGILDGMKSALGIHSPSRVMRDIVGKNIVLGIGTGFDLEMPKLYRKMYSGVNGLVDGMNSKLQFDSSVDLKTSKVSEDKEYNGKKVIINNTYNSPKPASIKELKQQDEIQMRRLAMQLGF